jgi:serine phosphatase RsbU (regulator of sigma subunit)
VVLHSDGLAEALCNPGELFGFDRVQTVIEQACRDGLAPSGDAAW